MPMKRLMPIYKQFDVVVVPFPFTDTNKTKRRPALVLSDRDSLTIEQSILAMITTKNHPSWSLDTVIKDLEVTGLNAPSMIRFKLFTLDNNLILKKIGSLSKYDRTIITAKMRKVFQI
jgi:mRNA interferase MazF